MSEFFAQNWPLWVNLALALAIVAICVRIYARLIRRVLAGHGKIDVAPYGLPDLLTAVVLMTWFGSMALRGYLRSGPAQPLTDSAVVANAILSGFILIVITLFLKARQINVSHLFGLRRPRSFPIIKAGFSLLIAALPLVFIAATLVQWIAGEEPEPQEVVKYFSHAAENAQWGRVALAAAFGIIIAPITEEFLFRGYFYGVLRRFLGPLPALFLVSLLFASIHLSIPSFLPLFLLAGCLTLAYEATGTLWTPILMHALFNGIMLGTMFLGALKP